MKALLTAVKSQLQTDLTYVRDGDIFVTEDENLIPEDVMFPAVGLKDGPVEITELPGAMMRYVMTVKIIAYAQIIKPEAAVMGDAATGARGVLDMAADIMASLDENLLSISGMQEAAPDSRQPESELFGDETEIVQRKIIVFKYVKEESRP